MQVITHNNKLKTIMYWYVMLLFFFPDDVFYNTAIVRFETPDFIRYKLGAISFSWLYIPIIIYGLFLYIKYKKETPTKYLELLVIIFINNVIRAIWINNILFKNSYYEVFLQMFFSLSVMTIVFHKNRDKKSLFKFFEHFILIHLLGLVFSIISGIGSFASRFHSQNLDVGGTGFIISLYTVYILFVKKTRFKIIYIIGLLILSVATGSRINILLAIGFIGLYFWNKYHSFIYSKIKKYTVKDILTINIILIIGLLGVLYVVNSNINIDINSKLDLERTINTFTGILTRGTKFLSEDDSVGGRLHSILVGIDILKENPMGLSFSIFDLQANMQYRNYPTFPHITVLAYLILMGPLFLIIIFSYIKTFLKLLVRKESFCYLLLYIILYSTIAGGAIINYKLIVIHMYALWVGKTILFEKKNDYKNNVA